MNSSEECGNAAELRFSPNEKDIGCPKETFLEILVDSSALPSWILNHFKCNNTSSEPLENHLYSKFGYFNEVVLENKLNMSQPFRGQCGHVGFRIALQKNN